MIKKLLRYCVVAIAIFMLVIACNSDTQLNNTQIDKSRSRPKGRREASGLPYRSAYKTTDTCGSSLCAVTVGDNLTR